MKPPFILDDSGDLSIFPTLEEVEAYLEPYDVRAGACVVYDSEGRRLQAGDDSRWFRQRVRLSAAEIAPTHAVELRRRLVTFLTAIGEPIGQVTERSLDELVGLLQTRLRPSR